MRLAISPLLVAVAYLISAPPSTLVSALPIPHNHHHHSRRSTPFRSLRGLTTLVNSFSNAHTYAQHAPNKYFHESTFHSHYDGRFASAEVPALERTWHLRLMLKAYTDTMERIGIQTWIMHGCLLGWWWGGTLMPWDKDLDFLVEEGGIAELGSWWNMTVHEFNARWIDVSNGLYIDITALHIAPTQSPDTSPSSSSPSSPSPAPSTPSPAAPPTQLYPKDPHAYTSTQLFPLRHTTLEGVPIKVPYAYEELLLEEYGDEALTERG
ncbi:LicD domain containing protein [Pyrenophora tritici-repentis]|nr:LicD domain containing protein [Pyrenophora tritici-repentis]